MGSYNWSPPPPKIYTLPTICLRPQKKKQIVFPILPLEENMFHFWGFLSNYNSFLSTLLFCLLPRTCVQVVHAENTANTDELVLRVKKKYPTK